ncbi:MAG: hypothetical protein JSW52_06360 [Candidatus Coatesbacteria bacterium]|nr:MAG: hypothetical protein JSW52_06360 [Candidatus Coatesbacteria bacterium]
MVKTGSIYLILLILITLNARANDAGTLLVEPWYEGRTPDTLYVALGRLAAAGVIEYPLMCPRPYMRGYVIELLEKGDIGGEGLSPADRWYLRRLADEFGVELGTETPNELGERRLFYETYEERVTAYIDVYGTGGGYYRRGTDSYLKSGIIIDDGLEYGERFAIRQRTKIFGFSGRDYVPEYIDRARIILKTGTYVDPYIIYASFGWPNISFQFGRDQMETGPGYHNQLLLSRNAPALDMFRFTLSFPRADWTAITARLEPADNRYLSLHGFVIRLFPWVDVGVSEAVIYQDDSFPSIYLNPFLPYYIEQNFRGDKDNMLIAAGLDFHLPLGVRLYGEYLTDGGMFSSRRDLEPFEKRGLLVGTYLPLTIANRPLDLRSEYTNVRNGVYSHKFDGNEYSYMGIPLGSYTGPDADEFWLWGGFRYWPNFETSAEITLRRKGEGDLSPKSYWSKDSFLTGVVEREKELAAGFLWENIFRFGALQTKVGYMWTENYEHEQGRDRNFFWADVQGAVGWM